MLLMAHVSHSALRALDSISKARLSSPTSAFPCFPLLSLLFLFFSPFLSLRCTGHQGQTQGPDRQRRTYRRIPRESIRQYVLRSMTYLDLTTVFLPLFLSPLPYYFFLFSDVVNGQRNKLVVSFSNKDSANYTIGILSGAFVNPNNFSQIVRNVSCFI